MVLELARKGSADLPLKQRDVRETPASTATATAVGLTDLDYVLLTTDADTTRDRVLTAGEGIDFSDTGAKGTLTINGEDASTTNKGIASFDASDFDTAAGVVTIDDSGVDHDATTNFLAAEHRNWETSIAQNIHANNYTDTGDTTAHASFSQLDFASAAHTGFEPAKGADDNFVTDAEKIVIGNTSGSNTGDQDTTYTAGEGLDLAGTVFSGENATTSNKGIASFNTNDFTTSSGAVSLKTRTRAVNFSTNSLFTTASRASDGERCHIVLPDAADTTAFLQWIIPPDWVSGFTIKIYYNAASQGNVNFFLRGEIAVEDGTSNQVGGTQEFQDTSKAAGDISVASFNAGGWDHLAKGASVGLTIQREATDGNDTVNDEIFLYAISIEYVSDC